MPQRKYSDIYRLSDLRNPVRPEMPIATERPVSIFDYIGAASKGVGDTIGAYHNSMMDKVKREALEDKLKAERAANEGRSKFRDELISGKEIPVMEEVPGYAGGDGQKQFQTGSKKQPLTEKEMIDSYLKNVPMNDDTDAKGMLGLLIDKNKPASIKMKEVTDAYDAEMTKAIETYKQQNGGNYPTKDIQEQMAFQIGGSPYAKMIKQSTSKETSFDQRKQGAIEGQRVIGNKQAEERLALSRANYDLQVGKDFRTDQQEYGKKLTDLQSVETHLDPVERKLAEGKVDWLSSKVGGDWTQFAQALAANDPELSSELGYLAAAYIKMISGAAVNEGEAVRLLGTVGVNVWSSPDKMAAGIKGMRNELDAKRNVLDNSYDRIYDHYKGKGKGTAPVEAPAAPKKESPAERMKRLGL